MTGYPHYPPHRTMRAGAAVLVLGLLLTVAAVRVQQRRWAWWDWQPPVHPSATTTPTVRSSRLWRWRVWSYATRGESEQVQRFYAQQLLAQGWQGGATQTVRRALVASWQQPPRVLRLRCEVDPQGLCQVSLLLTDAAGVPSELQGDW